MRAAFKAGVKPSAIARQFGISQSDIRTALAGVIAGAENLVAKAAAAGASEKSECGDYNPRAISAQWSTLLLLSNSMTPGSIVAAWSWGTTAVATIMSQRSLKATDSADLPGWLRAVSA